VTDPGSFCKKCRAEKGKREKVELAALEARVAALKGEAA
jgi:hypothetical protein